MAKTSAFTQVTSYFPKCIKFNDLYELPHIHEQEVFTNLLEKSVAMTWDGPAAMVEWHRTLYTDCSLGLTTAWACCHG